MDDTLGKNTLTLDGSTVSEHSRGLDNGTINTLEAPRGKQLEEEGNALHLSELAEEPQLSEENNTVLSTGALEVEQLENGNNGISSIENPEEMQVGNLTNDTIKIKKEIVKHKQLDESKRLRVCKLYEIGKPVTQIAKELDITYTAAYSVIRIYKKTGRIKSEKYSNKGRKQILSSESVDYIKELIKADPKITLKVLSEKILNEFNLAVSQTTINRALDGFRNSLKSDFIPPEANGEENLNTRFEYSKSVVLKESEDLIFLDTFEFSNSLENGNETSFDYNLNGNSISNVRSNVIVAAAMYNNKIILFKVVEDAVYTVLLYEFIKELMNLLKSENSNKRTIVMGNCSAYLSSKTHQLIQYNNQELVCLPIYFSNQLNPMHEIFFIWKTKVKEELLKNDNNLINAILNTYFFLTTRICKMSYLNTKPFLLKALLKEPL